MPSMLKCGRKVSHLRCDSQPVSRSNGERSGLEAGGGIPCRLNPAGTLLVRLYLIFESNVGLFVHYIQGVY